MAQRSTLPSPKPLRVKGKIYDHLGEFDKEQQVWEQILEIQHQFYSRAQKHPALATTHYDYASLFLRKGEYDKAAEHLQSSLADYGEELGKDPCGLFWTSDPAGDMSLRAAGIFAGAEDT